jgi:3-methyladenine DNA glycosylase AlkD
MPYKKQLPVIAAEIKEFCINNADKNIVTKYSKYFKDGYLAYGLTEELLNKEKDTILKKYGEIGINGFLDLGDILFKEVKYEECSFAILFMEEFVKDFNHETFNRISKWFDTGVHNWAHCDIICGRLISRFREKNLVTMDDLADWRNAENFYKRRAVPVSLIYFLKYQDNHKAMLEFISPLIEDQARTVQQGMGWFLRELWKKNPDMVEDFLYNYRNTAQRLIIQYATEKMDQEQKLRFKRDKKS